MKKLYALVLFAATFFTVQASYAQQTYTAQANGNWTAGGTWDRGSQPGAGDHVVIPSGFAVNVNENNREITNLQIDEGGLLIINNQREVFVNGNLTIDGDIDFRDGGSIESLGIIMQGAGSVLDGTGRVFTTQSINNENGRYFLDIQADITIAATADLEFFSTDPDFRNMIRVANNTTVTNNGRLDLQGDLDSNGAGSTWINASSTAYIRLGRNFFNNGAVTASAAGNTIEYAGALSQNIKPTTYSNLVLGGSENKNLQADVVVGGNLRVSSRFITNDFNVTVGGNLVNNGAIVNGTETFTLNGSSTQTISGNGSQSFYNLTIALTGGQLEVQKSFEVSNTLTINNTTINAGSNVLSLGTSAANPGTLVTTGTPNIIGSFRRWVVSVFTDIEFPVGIAGAARPLTFNFSNLTSGALTVSFVNANPGAIANPPLADNGFDLNNLYNAGYWRAAADNGLASNEYSVAATATSFSPFTVSANTRLLTRTLNGTTWQAIGAHNPGAFAAPIVRRTALNLLPAEFALAEQDACSFPEIPVITGPTSLCQDDRANKVYSVPLTASNVYSWSVVGGTITGGTGAGTAESPSVRSGADLNSITVSWNAETVGTVSVTEDNSPNAGCGTSLAGTLEATVNPVPAGPITGRSVVAEGQADVTYSVPASPNNTYVWSISGSGHSIVSGQGTASIVVDWNTATAGNYTVSATTTNTSPCSSVAATPVTFDVSVEGVVFSVQSGNWTAAATWNTGRQPTVLNNVRITAGHTVNVNENVRQCKALEIEEGAELAINNQREITINGDFTLNGTLRVNDGGNVESLGVIMAADDAILDGTGTFITTQSINGGGGSPLMIFDANTTIAASADLTFNATDDDLNTIIQVNNLNIVTNFGKITTNQSLAVQVNAKWINRSGAHVTGARDMFTNGALDASEPGNTIEYNGSRTQNIKTAINNTYGNLIIGGSGVKNMTERLVVNGNLSISSQLLPQGFDLEVQGNWTNTGTYTPGTTMVTLSGSGQQTITNATGETFYNLSVLKNGTNVVLNGNIQVDNALDINNGFIVTGANVLTLGSGPTVTGSFNLTAPGHVVGNMRRWITVPNGFFTFPIGTASQYRPVTVNTIILPATGTITASFIEQSPGSIDPSPLVDGTIDLFALHPEGYWFLSPGNGISLTRYNVTATAAGFSTFTPTFNTRLVSREAESDAWTVNGNHVDGPTTFVSPEVKREELTNLPAQLALAENNDCEFPTTSPIFAVDGTILCQDDAANKTYEVSITSGNTYSWQVIGGTITGGTGAGTEASPSVRSAVDLNSITVSWNGGIVGQVQVIEDNTANSGCGAGVPQTLEIHVAPLPAGAVSGPAAVTTGQASSTYSVPAVTNYTYIWAISGSGANVTSGQGTNSVNIDWTGAAAGNYTVTVTAINNSPCSSVAATPVTYDVTVQGVVFSVQSGNWTAAATWNTGRQPTVLDNVRISDGTTVSVNENNRLCNSLEITANGRLNFNNQRELTVNGDLTLNGTVEFFDGGNIESLGLIMAGNGSILDGTGTFITRSAINNGGASPLFIFDANITIAASADITFTAVDDDLDNFIRLDNNVIVTNFGRITINRSLRGANTTARWINKSGAYLSVASSVLNTGQLDAREPGNTVEYSGGANQNIKNSLESTYANLILSGSNNKDLTANTLVTGDLTISSSLRPEGFDLELQGNWNNTGQFEPQNVTVTFSGTNNQTLFTASGIERFHNLNINKTANALSLGTNNNIQVLNTLSLSAGAVNTGASSVTLGTSTNPGEEGTLVSTNQARIIGTFVRYVNSNNNTNLLMPIGTATSNRGINMRLNNFTPGTLSAVFVEADPGRQGLPLSDGSFTLFNTFFEGYWRLEPGNGLTSTSYNVGLTSQNMNSYSQATARVLTRSTSSAIWTVNGSHVPFSDGVVSRNGITTLPAELALGDINNCTNAQANSITGNTLVCGGSTDNEYTVNNGLPGSTYTWTLENGFITAFNSGSGFVAITPTNTVSGASYASIRVSWQSGVNQGRVSVVEDNNFDPVFGCGPGQRIDLDVQVAPLPTSAITGATSAGTSQTGVAYSVEAIANTTYSWSVTGGTIVGGTMADPSTIAGADLNAITVDWGSTAGTYTVTVTATNTDPCTNESAAPVSLNVTLLDEIIAIQNGNWTAAGTWSSGRQPTQLDNVRIPAGRVVNVNENNREVRALVIEDDATLIFNNQRELLIYGDLTLDGVIDIRDGGNVESGGVILAADGTVLDGVGEVFNTQSVNANGDSPLFKFVANITIANTANIRITATDPDMDGLVAISNNKIVTNFGRFEIDGDMTGGASSRWINKTGAILDIEETLMNSGVLVASEPGNTVIYSGSINQNIKLPDNGYFNLVLSGASAKSLTGATTVLGNLDVSSTLNFNAFNLELAGNLNNTGTFDITNETISFTGDGDQTLTATSAFDFYNVTMAKISGSLILENDLNVSNTLVYRDGNIVTGNFNLTLGTDATSEGTLDLATFNSGAIVGNFRRWADATGPHTFTFPVGINNTARLLTATFDNITTGGLLVSQFVSSAPGNNGLPLVDDAFTARNTFPEGYWQFTSPTPNNIAFTNFDIALDANGFSAYAIDANTRVLSRTNSGTAWVFNGTHLNASGNVVNRTGLTALPLEFALGDDTACDQPNTSAISYVSGDECVNRTAVYEVVNTPSSTYTWSVDGGDIIAGQGTNQVQITWDATGGTKLIQVVEDNSAGGGCGQGAAVVLERPINPIDLGSITGLNAVAANTTGITYSIPAVAGYTYTWSAIGGTVSGTGNSITVDWGEAGNGSVSVFGTFGACGVSTDIVTLDVNIFAEIESTQSGNWTAGGTWVGGSAPQPTNSVRIRAPHVVTLNENNRITQNFVIEPGARLVVSNQRELTVEGNFVLDGEIQHNDGGNVESFGIVMTGNNTLSGTGSIFSTQNINNGGDNNPMLNFNGNITILAGTDISVTATDNDYNRMVRVSSNRIVTNFGNITIQQDLQGQGGATWINKAGATLTVGENLLSTGSTLDATEAGNTVVYQGSSNEQLRQPLNNEYANLVIQGDNIKRLQSNIVVTGNLSVNETVSFRLNGFDLVVGGNFIVNSTAEFQPGSNSVTLNGSLFQAFDPNAALENLIINKTGGIVQLQNNVQVNTALTMTSGNINTQAFTLTLGTGTGSTGTLNHNSGSIIGNLQRWVSGTGSVLFPLGTNSFYRPLTITPSTITTGGTLTGAFNSVSTQELVTIVDGAQTVQNIFDEGFWSLAPANGVDITGYNMNLTASGFTSFVPTADTRLVYRANNASPWAVEGTHVAFNNDVASRIGLGTASSLVSGGDTREFGLGDVDGCPEIVTTAIVGNTEVCLSDLPQVYTVDGSGATPGNTYNWVVPAGVTFADNGNSISITDWGAGGEFNITVTEQRVGCPDGTTQEIDVNVNPVLFSGQGIAGPIAVITQAQGQRYSVPFRTGYCYQWSITTGNGTIIDTDPNGAGIVVNWSETNEGADLGNVRVVITYTNDANCGAPVNFCSGASAETLNRAVSFTNTYATTAGGGNFSDPATWGAGAVPPPNASITITDNTTLVLDAPGISVKDLVIDGDTDGLGQAGGVLDNAGNQLTINGDYTLNGRQEGAGTTIIAGSTTATITGSGTKADGRLFLNNNTNFDASAVLTIGGIILMFENTTANNFGDITINGFIDGANDQDAIWLNQANSTLRVSGLFSTGRINAGASNNRVIFSRDGDQSIRFPTGAPGQYYNLTLEGIGTKTLTGDLTVENLTIDEDDNGDAVLDAGDNVLTVLGDFTNNNTFSSNGTVIISGAEATQRINGNGNTTLTNLVIDKSAGTFEYVPGNLSISGGLTVSRGTFAAQAASNADLVLNGNFRIGASGTFNGTDFNRISLTGDLELESGGTFTQDQTEIEFNGSGTQTATGLFTFYNLTKSNGGNLVLEGGNKTVTNQLGLTSGTITSTADNLLVLNDGSTVTPDGGSAGSYVVGPVRMFGSSDKVFPIGFSHWARVGLLNYENGSADDAFDVEYRNGTGITPNTDQLGTGINNVSTGEYWDITRSAGDANVQVRLYWEDADRSGITDPISLLVAHFTGGQWVSEGGVAVDNGDGSGFITTSARQTSFSPEALGNTDPTPGVNTLPVEFAYFRAQPNTTTVLLEWGTASELNNDRFEVQRSINGVDFTTIGTVGGAGTTATPQAYSFIDEQPLVGTTFYRLRQVDFDGAQDFSSIVTVFRALNSNTRLAVYPNPIQTGANLTLELANAAPNTPVRVLITDLYGKMVKEQVVTPETANTTYQLSTQSLATGIYVLHVRGKDFRASKRITVE